MKYCTNIGIDAHSRKNSVCALIDSTGEVRSTTLSENPSELIRWVFSQSFPEPIGCVYESGPTGFGLARALRDAGLPCTVAATSKLPMRIDRQKNDRIDAEWLARMLAAGSIRPVRVPSVEEEALCHLSRLRGEIAADLRAAKQRVVSFLLLTGTEYTLGKKRWTKRFCSWAEAHEFAQPADTFVFREKLSAVYRLEERLRAIEDEIMRRIGESPELSSLMARLRCIHGIGPIAAFSLVCEVHDFGRFRNGAAFASYLGLTPSENSSGKRTSHGGVAKTGNAHLRRILIESASKYSHPFKIAKSEDESVPELVRSKAQSCAARLRRRRIALVARGVNKNKAKVAVARELAEWIYWIAVMPA